MRDKPERLGEASSDQPHPAVPVLGQGPLTAQNQHPLMCVQPLGEASPGRGHQDDLPLEKLNLMEFLLRSAEQTYLGQ